MVNGHTAQPRVSMRNCKGVSGAHIQAVQVQRTVAVDDTFRCALGARRVAHSCAGIFVELRPVEAAGASVDE